MATNDSSTIPTPSQPRLNLDCIKVVLDHVYDRHTILALLTVSKDIFALAVKKLYRPWSFRPGYSQEGAEAFVRFILSLSPEQGELAVAVRNHLQIQWPREPPPFIDYLSLVNEIHYYTLYTCSWDVSVSSSASPITLTSAKLRSLLMWAIFGHRLSEVVTLRFESREEFELFGQHVEQLTSLRRVVLSLYWDGIWTTAQSFIKAYIAYHGEAAKRLSFSVAQGAVLSRQGVETMALLSPPPPPKEIRAFNLLHCAAHLNQLDFSRVREAFVDHSTFAERVDLWSQLLAKCSSLRSLDLRGLRSQRKIFQWAVQERYAGRPIAPLKTVKLKFCNFILYPTVNDLLEGFGATLESVKIKCGWDDHWLTTPFDNPRPRIASGLHLPKLRTLEARVFSPYVFAFDPEDMPTMPSLEVLKLDHAAVLQLDDYPGSLAQYDENISTVFPIKTWPICEFPRLRVLCLTGRPAAEFNPSCLQFMSCLEELTLVLDTSNWADYWPIELWTWDWELPALRAIALGQLMATAFQFKALRHMPNIESVILGGINDRHANFSAIFDLPLDHGDGCEDKGMRGVDSESIQGCSAAGAGIANDNGGGDGDYNVLNKSIKSIEVEGSSIDMDVSLWRKLLNPRTFPGLKNIYIGGYGGVHNASIIHEASCHPGLTELWLSKSEHQQEAEWPADEIDQAWETGARGRPDDDGYLLFHVNSGCYRVPKKVWVA